VSVFGICTGCAIHTLAAAFGLSAVLAASASAFLMVKFAGALYLGYLGLRLLLERGADQAEPIRLPREHLWRIYRQGVITNVLNPKVALFFLSFLPQFVDSSSSTKIPAFLVLGAVFVFNSALYCLTVAWFAAAISTRLRRGTGTRGGWLKRAAGALFVGLGLKLAVSR
jgi:threonine/homoserine/homoserine lactone efflux protein